VSRRLNIGLAVLVLALLVAFAVLVARDVADDGGSAAESADPAGTTRAAAVRAAAEQVRTFLDVDHTDVDDQLDSMLATTTEEFRRQFADQLDTIRSETLRRQSSADVTILRTGLSESSAASAVVLVAADTEVTSRVGGTRTREVPWRIRVDLVRDGDRWLTDGLRFVN
jgi:Mce-associated membrane protein